MRTPGVCLAFVLLASSPRLATAGLDLTWNACNTSASGADNVTLDCATLSGSQLFANFQSAQAIPQFLAMDAVIDIRTAGGTLPPFWHLESGGCNQAGLGLTDAKSASLCPNATNGNLWGANGNEATAAITAYDPGHGGTDRLRVLITIARAASSPVALTAGQNYYGFEVDFATDNAGSCAGCTTPAVIGWSKAVLYGSSQTIELYQSGTRLASVAVNGGIPGPTVFTVRPESAPSTAPASADLFGRNLVSGTTAKLTRSGQSDISGTGTTTSTLGDLLHTTFDITGKPDGFWNVNVANGGNTDGLVNAFRTTGAFLVDSMFPRLGGNGMSVPVTIYGSQLLAPATVRLKRLNQPDVVGTGTTVAGDGHSLQTTFALQMVDLGLWDVEVTNGDGAKKNVPGGFEIVTSLQITSVSPNVASNGGSAVLAVGGAGFRPGVGVALQRAGATDIPGQVLSVDPEGTSLQAQFDLLNRPAGLWNLRAVNPGGLPVVAGNVLLIGVGPTVTSITPNSGTSGPLTVVISGTNFDALASPQLSRSGQGPIPGTDTQVGGGGTTLTTTFDLTNRVAGFWNVEVFNPGNFSGMLPAGFQILPGPTVTSMTPVAALDTSVVSATVFGSNFQSGASAMLKRAGEPDIVGTSVVVAAGGSSLTALFDIRGRTGGLWNVFVANPDGGNGTLVKGFTVWKISTVTAIAPSFGAVSVFAVITGTGFVSPLQVRLERTSVPAIVGTVGVTNPTSINVSFNLTGKPLGFYDVVVINLGGFTTRLNAAFEIRPQFSLTAVTPTLAANTGPVSLTVTGANFNPGMIAKLTRASQPTVVGTSVTVDPGGAMLTATFDITGQLGGYWNLEVANPGGPSLTLTNAITITQVPILSNITPAIGSDAETISTFVFGTGFVHGLSVRLERPAVTITGTLSPPPGDGTVINPSFNLAGAPLGLYDVVVDNPGNLEGRLNGGFEVRPAVFVTSVTPSVAPDTSIATLVVSGSNLQPGLIAKLTRTLQTDIVGTSVSVAPGGLSFGASFDIRGKASGPWNVMVTNPNGISATLTNGFTIAKIPTVSSIVPATGADASVVTSVIAGSQFAAGLSVRLESASSPPIPGTVNSSTSTSISATFDLLQAAPPPGFYDVVVTNPGPLEGRLVQGFQVIALAQITSFSPLSGLDTAQVLVTVHGAHFDFDDTVRLTGASLPTIVGGGTVVANRNRLTTTFDLRGQPVGARTLQVIQHDGTVLTAATSFYIFNHELTGAPPSVVGEPLALRSVVPNPTTGPATAMFTLPTESAVRLSVVDLQGRELAEIAHGVWPAGGHEARWDGRGRQGAVPTGMYFVRMEVGGRTFMKRFVMTR